MKLERAIERAKHLGRRHYNRWKSWPQILDADDYAQEAMIAYLEGRAQRHGMVDAFRKQQLGGSQKGEGRRYPEFSALVEGGTGDLGDGWDGVRRLERGVLLGQIRNQIKGLPIRTQHMMGLYYFGGYTMREIGKIFDRTDSWVHQVLRTAINQIKRRLT